MFAFYNCDPTTVALLYENFSSVVHVDHRERVDRQLTDTVAGFQNYYAEFPIDTSSVEARCIRTIGTITCKSSDEALAKFVLSVFTGYSNINSNYYSKMHQQYLEIS